RLPEGKPARRRQSHEGGAKTVAGACRVDDLDRMGAETLDASSSLRANAAVSASLQHDIARACRVKSLGIRLECFSGKQNVSVLLTREKKGRDGEQRAHRIHV